MGTFFVCFLPDDAFRGVDVEGGPQSFVVCHLGHHAEESSLSAAPV